MLDGMFFRRTIGWLYPVTVLDRWYPGLYS